MKTKDLCNADKNILQKGLYKISAREQITVGDIAHFQELTSLYNDWEIMSSPPLLK